MITLASSNGSINEKFKKSWFRKGQYCPYYESTSVVKNSKLKGKQCYLCHSCKKSVNDLIKSVLSCTKLSLQTWTEYIKGMIRGFSIKKNAENVGVCVKILFYMKYKIFDCIRVFMGIRDVDGILEMDETFVANLSKLIIKRVDLKCQDLLVKR